MVEDVLNGVKNNSEEHFRGRVEEKPSLMNLNFKQNRNKDNEVLKMHMRNEVISFEFLKEFWEDIKVDVLKFITKFHINGCIVRWVNSSFIV